MYLELVDVLRCTTPHEDSPLVASIARRADRDIIDGTLGCSVCYAEYPIEQGVAILGGGLGPRPDRPTDRLAEVEDDLAVRCAAMLGLFEPGGVVILGGDWGRAGPGLVEMTRSLAALIEPPAAVQLGNGVAAVRTGDTLPFAPSSVRGIALDGRTSLPALVESAARALQAGGRLIAATSAAVPAGLIERARDDRHWVAEATAATTPPIQLLRGR